MRSQRLRKKKELRTELTERQRNFVEATTPENKEFVIWIEILAKPTG